MGNRHVTMYHICKSIVLFGWAATLLTFPAQIPLAGDLGVANI